MSVKSVKLDAVRYADGKIEGRTGSMIVELFVRSENETESDMEAKKFVRVDYVGNSQAEAELELPDLWCREADFSQLATRPRPIVTAQKIQEWRDKLAEIAGEINDAPWNDDNPSFLDHKLGDAINHINSAHIALGLAEHYLNLDQV